MPKKTQPKQVVVSPRNYVLVCEIWDQKEVSVEIHSEARRVSKRHDTKVMYAWTRRKTPADVERKERAGNAELSVPRYRRGTYFEHRNNLRSVGDF